jgi:hypothetical protein
MILPGADRAFVDPRKVRKYLLSLDHPEGRDKARVFAGAGYSAGTWQLLARQLRWLARFGLARPGAESRFGWKYEVDGILQGPSGDSLSVRTIWIVRHGQDFPRLVTAYPGRHR